jgi:hypothetical protein
MRRLQRSIGTIALAVAAMLVCSGCPALMVPGVAYQGYKYEHSKNEPTATSTSTQSKKSPTDAQKKIPDSDIE